MNNRKESCISNRLDDYHLIGKSHPRGDAYGKVCGATKYAGDLDIAGMLHVKILRSVVACAKIISIDASQARQLDGVACILLATDINNELPASGLPGQSSEVNSGFEQTLLAKHRIRYHGEPIALIAAESVAIAGQALELISLELEEQVGVYDPAEALQPGAPVVQGNDNLVAQHRIKKGSVQNGFSNSDYIVESKFETQFVEHAFLEPEAGIAWVDGEGVINIECATQVIEHYRFIATALGLPHNKVRVRAPMVGGAFGGKEDITVELYLALLALETKRPVKLVYTREESFFGHGKRHPFSISYRSGVNKEGKILAIEVKMLADAGAYVYLSPYVAIYAASTVAGPYLVDNISVDVKAAATNNMYTSALRAFGTAQACLAHEQQIDEIAKITGIDRLEIRRKNFLKTGDETANGQIVESAVMLEECMTSAWKRLSRGVSPNNHIKIGRGVACYQQSYGRLSWLNDSAEAWVGLELDGTVVVRLGIPDIGAGQSSAFAQIAAEIFGVNLESVSIYCADSAKTPLAGTVTATRSMYMGGNAVRAASEAIKERLMSTAATYLECSVEDIAWKANIGAVAKSGKIANLKTLVGICQANGVSLNNTSKFSAPGAVPPDDETGQGKYFPDFAFGAHAVEVSVDIETGEVRVIKSVGAHDVGQVINRTSVEGQIEGAAIQGQGFALMENMIYENGQLTTPSLSEYLIPTAADVPKIESILFESKTGLGPFGSKGIGEPAMTAVAAAIANAVADAIDIRVASLPITAEKIVMALKEK